MRPISISNANNAHEALTMSDSLSDEDIPTKATHVESEEDEIPRDTVEENGLDDDDDDLFGDGGDDQDNQPA